MINILLSRLCILTCGTLYPGYMSFKTVRAKNVNDYVIWMMYWIVLAIFTATEGFGDIFLTWLPFYYELKIVFILWLVPTYGNGSSFIYKHFIHSFLKKHETHVDSHLRQVRAKGQALIVQYVKDAVLCTGKSIMNAINKNIPNAISGLCANGLPSKSEQYSQNVIIEEIEVQQIAKQTNQRKISTKASRIKNHDGGHIVQTRGRKTRQSQQ